jgi:RNA-directed DNA polymerase
MSEMTSETTVEIPKAFAENGARNLPWVFELRKTLYCKAKQEPKYQFYTLYGLVCKQEVIESAWRQVSRNKGAPGMDGISIEEIRNSKGGAREFLENIRQELLSKTYKPDVVKRVYILKANGKLRPLGIPTVKDRVVQTAVKLVIEPIFEADFLECSYAPRRRRMSQSISNRIR